MEEGFDVGMEMSGNPLAFQDLLRTMHHGGKVAILGIPPSDMAIDWNQVIFKGLVLKGIYGREMFETWYKMSSMLQSGLNIDPIITHHFPFATPVASGRLYHQVATFPWAYSRGHIFQYGSTDGANWQTHELQSGIVLAICTDPPCATSDSYQARGVAGVGRAVPEHAGRAADAVIPDEL